MSKKVGIILPLVGLLLLGGSIAGIIALNNRNSSTKTSSTVEKTSQTTISPTVMTQFTIGPCKEVVEDSENEKLTFYYPYTVYKSDDSLVSRKIKFYHTNNVSDSSISCDYNLTNNINLIVIDVLIPFNDTATIYCLAEGVGITKTIDINLSNWFIDSFTPESDVIMF